MDFIIAIISARGLLGLESTFVLYSMHMTCIYMFIHFNILCGNKTLGTICKVQSMQNLVLKSLVQGFPWLSTG